MRVPDQIKILFVTQIMFTGARAIVALGDIAGCGRETVPVAWPGAAEGLSFDLVGRCGCAEKEVGGKV